MGKEAEPRLRAAALAASPFSGAEAAESGVEGVHGQIAASQQPGLLVQLAHRLLARLAVDAGSMTA